MNDSMRDELTDLATRRHLDRLHRRKTFEEFWIKVLASAIFLFGLTVLGALAVLIGYGVWKVVH